MNVIGNNCIGGFIYKYANIPYSNPFIWTGIYGSSLEYILTHFNSINFSNAYLHDVSGNYDYNVVIDNKLDVSFWRHYKYSPSAGYQQIINDAIYSNDIGNFILNTYRKRLRRMTEPPTFVIHWWAGLSTCVPEYWKTTPPTNDFLYLSSLTHKNFEHKVIIFGPYKEINPTGNNVFYIYDETCTERTNGPAIVAKKHLSDILHIINEI